MASIKNLRFGLPKDKEYETESFTKKPAPTQQAMKLQPLLNYKSSLQSDLNAMPKDKVLPLTGKTFDLGTTTEYKAEKPREASFLTELFQNADVRKVAKDEAQVIADRMENKYKVKIKRANSPIEFANMLLKVEDKEGFKKDYSEYLAKTEKANPFSAGVESGFNILPTMAEAEAKTNPEVAKAQENPLYGGGRIAGGIGQQGAFYGLLGAPIEGLLTKGLGSAAATGLGKFGVEAAKDVAIGLGTGLAEAPFDKTTGKQLATNVVADIALNALFGAVGKGIGAITNKMDLFKAKTPEVIEQVAKELNVDTAKADEIITKAVNEIDDATLNSIRTKQMNIEPMLAPSQIDLTPKTVAQTVETPKAEYFHVTGNKDFKFDPNYSPVWQTMGNGFYATKDVNKWAVPLQAKGTMRNSVVPVDTSNVKIIKVEELPTQSEMAKEIIKSFDGDSKKALKFVEQFEPTSTTLGGRQKIDIATEIAYSKTKGYDAIERTTEEGNELLIFNKEKVKTQDPIDIYDFIKGENVSIKQKTDNFSDEVSKNIGKEITLPWGDNGVIKNVKGNSVEITDSFGDTSTISKEVYLQSNINEPTLSTQSTEIPTKPLTQRLKEMEETPVKNIASDLESESLTIDVSKPKKVDIDREPIDVKSLIMTDLPVKAKAKPFQTLERVYQETVSKNVPFENIARKSGDELLGAKASNLNRTTGTVDYNISKAQTNMEGDEVGKSIQGIWSDVPEAQKEDFFEYLLQKHNIDRYAQEKPVFGDTITSDMSAKRVAELEAEYPEFANKQAEVTTFFDNLVNDWGVKSGLVSEDTAKLLKEMYKNYVPTYRAMDIDKTMGAGSGNFVDKIIKKAEGSERKILPIEQQMAMIANKTIRNARKNEVMLALDDVYQANPEVASKYITDVKKVGAKKPIDEIGELGSELEKEVVKDGNNYLVTFYKNGEPHQMTVNKTLYEAMRTMESDTIDNVLGVFRTYATNPFKGLITTYNPLFAVRNIMRDIPTALIYSNDTLGLIKNTPAAVKEMLTNGANWKKYQALGGTRSGLFNYEKGVKIELDKAKGFKDKAKEIALNTGEKVGAINNFTETLPRFAEYLTSVKKGEDPMLALMRSAEITTDFSRFGKQTKRADAVVPYLNASMQGIDKFVRQVRDKPLQTMAKGGLVVSVPALILDQVNKDNEAYNDMTSRERNTYYHIPKEDGTFYRIPRSREVGVLFGTLFEWATRKARGQEVTTDEIKEVLKSNFTPVNGFDSNILKPAMNFWNVVSGKDPDAKNFFGSNIVSESLQKYSPSQQFDESSTVLSKALGEYLDVSPKAIDYLLDSYLGVIADVGMPLLSEKKKSAVSPLENAFIADPVYKSDSLNKFYDSLETLRAKANDFNKKNDIPGDELTPIEKERSKLDKISKELTELRKQQTKALVDGQDKKARELREAMNQLAKKAFESQKSKEELAKELDAYLKKVGGNK